MPGIANAASATAAAEAQPAHSSREPAPPPKPLPTLQDAHRLTPQDDFAPFAAREVPPEVRNAAMKKLFADPHYQRMDGLDIYIDDYSLPSPLSPAQLRQMASAQFLNLVQAPDETCAATQTPDRRPERAPESLPAASPEIALASTAPVPTPLQPPPIDGSPVLNPDCP